MAAAGHRARDRAAHAHGADLFYEAAVGGAHPDPARAAHLAGRRADRAGDGHRQRDDELHPHDDDRARGATTRAPWPRPRRSATPRPTRRPTSRASTPRPRCRSSRRSPSAPSSTARAISARASPGCARVGRRVRAARRATSSGSLGVAERVGDHGAVAAGPPGPGARSRTRWPRCDGAMNAVFVEGARSGPLMWLGQGAGGAPTATAVLGDVLDAARNRVSGRHDAPFRVVGDADARAGGRAAGVFYLSARRRRPPRRARRGRRGVFGAHGVSIRSMEQVGLRRRGPARFLHPRARAPATCDATIGELARSTSVDADRRAACT